MYTFSIKYPFCEEKFFDDEEELIEYMTSEKEDKDERDEMISELYEVIEEAKTDPLGMARYNDLAKIYYLPRSNYGY